MRQKNASIRQLEYFVTVARSTNFRQAAEKLGISQPTLTAQIATLEEALGAQLFERSRAGTLLSPAGREMLPLARSTLEQYQQLLHFADHRRSEPSGVFRLGVLDSFGPWLLPRILPELRDLYPKLRLHVLESPAADLESGLAEGRLDLVMSVLPTNAVENQVRPLFRETFDLVVPADHALAMKPLVTLDDLDQQELLACSDDALQRVLLNICERSGANLQEAYAASSLSGMQQMVMMGMGVAIMPSLYVRSEITGRTQNLVVVPLASDLASRSHVVAWRRNAPGRQLFQKLSYDIKVLALDLFAHVLDEISTEDGF